MVKIVANSVECYLQKTARTRGRRLSENMAGSCDRFVRVASMDCASLSARPTAFTRGQSRIDCGKVCTAQVTLPDWCL